MKSYVVVLSAVAFLGLLLGCASVSGYGLKGVERAMEQIEANMPAEDQEISGVIGVLEEVAATLEDAIPTEMTIPVELPEDAGPGIAAANSALGRIPV